MSGGAKQRPGSESKGPNTWGPIQPHSYYHKRQHMNNKHHCDQNLHYTLSSGRIRQPNSASIGGGTSNRGAEEGGEIPLSGNWVQVLSHHSSHHLSLCDFHPCWNLRIRQSSPRASSRTPAPLSLSGVTSSSSSILALFLTPVAVSPFSPILKNGKNYLKKSWSFPWQPGPVV